MPVNEDNPGYPRTGGEGGRGGGKKRLLCKGMYRVPTRYLAQSVTGRGRSSTPTPSLSQKLTQPSKFCTSSYDCTSYFKKPVEKRIDMRLDMSR